MAASMKEGAVAVENQSCLVTVPQIGPVTIKFAQWSLRTTDGERASVSGSGMAEATLIEGSDKITCTVSESGSATKATPDAGVSL